MLNTIDGLEKENMINKMKNIVLLISLFVLSVASAQDCVVQKQPNWGSDSASCRTNVSLYTEFLKQKTGKTLQVLGGKRKSHALSIKLIFIKMGPIFIEKLLLKELKLKMLTSVYMLILYL